MSGYTKLFGSIIHSTIWQAPDHVRLVWITMLAMADKRSVVEASVPGLAKAASVSLERCEQALAELLAPDPYSRSKEHEGRRISVVPGGWLILNRAKYRDGANLEHEREVAAERQRRCRANRRTGSDVTVGHALSRRDVTVGHALSLQTESETEKDPDPDQREGEHEREPPATPAPTKGASRRGRPRAPETPLPENLRPTEQDRAYCEVHNLDGRLQWEQFKAHAQTTDRRCRSWPAAWRMWLSKARGYQQERNARAPERAKQWAQEKAQGVPPVATLFPAQPATQSAPTAVLARLRAEDEARHRAALERQKAAERKAARAAETTEQSNARLEAARQAALEGLAKMGAAS